MEPWTGTFSAELSTTIDTWWPAYPIGGRKLGVDGYYNGAISAAKSKKGQKRDLEEAAKFKCTRRATGEIAPCSTIARKDDKTCYISLAKPSIAFCGKQNVENAKKFRLDMITKAKTTQRVPVLVDEVKKFVETLDLTAQPDQSSQPGTTQPETTQPETTQPDLSDEDFALALSQYTYHDTYPETKKS